MRIFAVSHNQVPGVLGSRLQVLICHFLRRPTIHSTGRCAIKPRSSGEFRR
jgi:hypothetical protein